jgi:glycosyltransferase involved in cell wall biosynthesis
MSSEGELPNICVVTFPLSKAGIVPLSGMLSILLTLSKNLYLITGNEGYDSFKDDPRLFTFGIQHKSGTSIVTRPLKYIYTQLRLLCMLVKIVNKVDIFIFSFGGETSVLLVLAAKLLGKRTVCRVASSHSIAGVARGDPFSGIWRVLETIDWRLFDRIIIPSESQLNEFGLAKHREKIVLATDHTVDLENFRIIRTIKERKKLVAYVGRLIEEKGVLNFVYSIPAILHRDSEINILIAGEGPLFDKILEYLTRENLNVHTKLLSWITHDRLPEYLNEAVLLVIPSFTETGPMIALEAMACGTPVLATRVGYIEDIVKDGETGFLLRNNSPDTIAESVLKAVSHPNLDRISSNARLVAEKQASHEKGVEDYSRFLKELGSKH